MQRSVILLAKNFHKFLGSEVTFLQKKRNKISFDDLDKAKELNDYFSSVYESDQWVSMLAQRHIGVWGGCFSVLEKVADDFGLFDVYDNRYLLPPDSVPSILTKRLAALPALPPYILFWESLIAGKDKSIWKMLVIPIQ